MAASAMGTSAIAFRRLSARLGIDQRTGHRLWNHGLAKRREIKAGAEGAYLIDMTKRIGSRRIGGEVQAAVMTFLVDHPNVRPSPYASDTLLVRGEDGKKNVRVERLLLEIGIPRLYQHFVEAHPAYAKRIGERKFGMLLPPNLRRMHHRRESCGCTDHIRMRGLHSTLVLWRISMAKKLGDHYKPPDHRHVSMACAECVCPDVPDPQNAGRSLGFPPAACWMRRGCGCTGVQKLRAKLPQQELAKGPAAQTITFRTYEYRIEISPRYGKKKRSLQLVKKTMAIGDFIDDVYLPTLEKFIYHDTLNRLLEKMRQQRKELEPGDVLDERDFAEKLAAAFEDAIQSEHWQNTSMTIETSVIECFKKEVVDAFLRQGSTPAEGELRDTQRFHLSDYERQNAEVVHRNMDMTIGKLLDEGKLKVRKTVRQGTDGCGGQYWCAKAGFLTSAISKRRRVSIDRARSAPGHGKRKVDGAHAVLKTLLREIMAMLDNGDERKPVIGAETHVEGEKRSFAAACHASAVKHLSTCRCDTFGMNKKRQAEARTVAREFDLYTHQDVKAALPEYEYDGKFKTIDPSTKEERQQKLPYSSWKAFHNLRCDHQLPEGEARLRRWPCFCQPCQDQLALPSLDERYGASLGCLMRPVFGSLNDWREIAFKEVASCVEEPCQGCDGDEDDGDDLEDEEGEEEEDGLDETEELEDDEFAAAEYTDRLADDVEAADMLAIPAPGDKKAAGHYVLEAESTAYVLTADEQSPDWGLLEAGTRVIDAFYWNVVGSPVSRPLWMTASDPPIRRKVPTHLLLLTGFSMPLGSNAKTQLHRAAVAKHARVLTEAVLDDIDQELAVRALWEEE